MHMVGQTKHVFMCAPVQPPQILPLGKLMLRFLWLISGSFRHRLTWKTQWLLYCGETCNLSHRMILSIHRSKIWQNSLRSVYSKKTLLSTGNQWTVRLSYNELNAEFAFTLINPKHPCTNDSKWCNFCSRIFSTWISLAGICILMMESSKLAHSTIFIHSHVIRYTANSFTSSAIGGMLICSVWKYC